MHSDRVACSFHLPQQTNTCEITAMVARVTVTALPETVAKIQPSASRDIATSELESRAGTSLWFFMRMFPNIFGKKHRAINEIILWL